MDKTIVSQILEHKRIYGLPKIAFEPNHPLASVVKSMVLEANTNGPINEIIETDLDITMLLGRYDELLANTPTLRNSLESHTTEYADGVITANHKLKSMRTNVDTLVVAIRKCQDTLLTHDPFYHAHQATENDAADTAPRCPWELLEAHGTADHISLLLRQRHGYTEHGSLSSTELEAAARMVLTHQTYAIDRFMDCSISTKSYDEIAASLSGDAGDLEVQSLIPEALKIITIPESYQQFRQHLVRNFSAVNGEIEMAVWCIRMGTAIDMVAKGIVSKIISLSEHCYDQIVHNIDLVMAHAELMMYYAWLHRTRTFAKALVMSNRMVNPDREEEFKREGGEESMIVRHLNARYKGHKVLPFPGVALESILENDEVITARLAQDTTNLKQRLKAKRNETLKHAANDVIVTALRPMEDKFVDAERRNLNRFVAAHVDMMLATDATLEDTLYKIMIHLTHPDDLVADMHQRLCSSYIGHMENYSTMTENAADRLQVGVAIDMVLDHIFDHCIA